MRRGLVLTAVISALVLGSRVAPAHAAGLPIQGTVAIFSAPGESILGGERLTFDSARGDRLLADASSPRTVGITVNSGDGEHYFLLVFSAPSGETLHAGAYPGATGTSGAQPEIDVSGDGAGCNGPDARGSFEVRDIAVDSAGKLLHAWILYAQSCAGHPSLFGEVRVGYPPAATTPTLLRWPDGEPAWSGYEVPVTVNAAGVTGATIAGAAAADFGVRGDECAGGAAGCHLWVRFAPAASGTREAVLRLTDAAGGVRAEIPLQSGMPAPTTDVTAQVGGDVATQARARHAAAAKTFVRVGASPRRARPAIARLLRASRAYRAAVTGPRALLLALRREQTSLRAYRTALRKAHGRALRRARAHAVRAVARVP